MAMTRTPILNRTLIERYKALIRYIFLSIVKFIFREPLANSRQQKFWLLVCSEISCVWGTLVDGERFKIRASAWLSEGGGRQRDGLTMTKNSGNLPVILDILQLVT